MKKAITFRFTLMVIAVFTLAVNLTIGQSTQNNDLKTILDAKSYSFTVTHETNGDVALGNYYFHLVNDSISVALPYHGNSGTAAYTMDDNGINVHTKSFSYELTPLKNGGYYIKINLNNDRLTRSFSLKVNKKGSALLTVESINRDPVSFTGVINSI